jgi:prepilin-type N-terminal cleavage/methylation domain-containing protein
MKRFSCLYKNNNGMTLVEVVVALAILGLIAISMLTMFSTGVYFVIKSGHNSENQYYTIQSMENKLADNLVTVPSQITPTTINNKTLLINFDGYTITTQGKVQKISFDDGDYEMVVSTFVPD